MSNAETKSESHHLDTTIDHLEKGVENHETTGASASITSWIKALASHDALKPIATDLEHLKEAISKKDGHKIVSLLEKLGDETTKAGAKAEGAEGEKVKKLGKLLTSSAKAVKGLVK